MNPHHLFIGIMALSVAIAVPALAGSELLEMLKVLGPVVAGLTLAMFLTRKYWRNARRIT
jgi:hypothetical protein